MSVSVIDLFGYLGVPSPKYTCAISTLFFVHVSKQRAGHNMTVTHSTIDVYSGVLCGLWKLCVPYYSADHPNNRIQEQITGKSLPGFHCMCVNKICKSYKHLAWEEAKEQ